MEKLWQGKSAIVAAHPDDEILFFSSIITKVDKIFICYLNNPKVPERKNGRLKALENYPLDNIEILNIDTSAASRFVDWLNPQPSAYGLVIKHGASEKAYQSSYDHLISTLRPKLVDFQNIFTHNPWGEYGHADHVQVHRAVKNLANESPFHMWCPNYVAHRSIALAKQYLIEARYHEPLTFPTNRALAETISQLYIQEGVWTVPQSFQWFTSESFNRVDVSSGRHYLFPLNFLPWATAIKTPASLKQRIMKRVRNALY